MRILKDDVDIEAYMMTQGTASSYKNAYQKEEENAKANKRGFWGFYKSSIKINGVSLTLVSLSYGQGRNLIVL
ncbi:hypothetical protein HUE58_00895 [Candidatus Ruthia endofausta]|uniref:TNase-like domain-containing protein n=1 Tax=Candidatus Ruthia endofausta TaxID=2738852 RepID=A0A6N0HN94_9GAMM|nr:hypothetical protein [Candidatus Ruthia endofausta]QKQ23780.1 hypothetical protein HUE58_00895 [Candidatus Ruthia endofausta]